MNTVKTRKPASERKKQIVDEAMRLAADLGPDRMTTQKLADAVGVSQAAIFRHFPSKTEIWQAVATRIAQAMPTPETLPSAPAPILIAAIVKRQFEFIEQTPAIPAILHSRELHAENEALRAQFSGMVKGRHAVIADLFRRGIDAGEFNTGFSPDDAASLHLALIQGLAMRWSLEKHGFDLVGDGVHLLELQMRAFLPD